MKKIFLFLFILNSIISYSQVLKKPSEGKSMVYFTRVDELGFLINFKYFDGENYLGKFNYGKYLAYECEPGKHLFWSKSENTDFIEADLEAGKIYIIDSQPQMGAFKAGVKLIPFNNDPLSYKNEKKYNRIKTRMLKSISGGKEYIISNADLVEAKIEHQDLVKRIMEKFNSLKAENKIIKQLPKEKSFE